MFFILDEYDIANYVDDSTPYVSGRNIEEVIASLEEVSSFSENGSEIINFRVMPVSVMFY